MHRMKFIVMLGFLATTAFAADPKQAAIKGSIILNITALPEPPPQNTATERDGNGTIVRQSGASSTGMVTTRDGNGRIIGTKYVSLAENVTYRDAAAGSQTPT